MRLIKPLAMTNTNIPRKKKLKKYINQLWYKSYKFLSFINSFLKRAKSTTDLKLSGKAFHALAVSINRSRKHKSEVPNNTKTNRKITAQSMTVARGKIKVQKKHDLL